MRYVSAAIPFLRISPTNHGIGVNVMSVVISGVNTMKEDAASGPTPARIDLVAKIIYAENVLGPGNMAGQGDRVL